MRVECASARLVSSIRGLKSISITISEILRHLKIGLHPNSCCPTLDSGLPETLPMGRSILPVLHTMGEGYALL